MPSPSGWSSTSFISPPSNDLIGALLGSYRWSSTSLTYSFPTSGAYWSTDSWSGYGPSTEDEPPWNGSLDPLSTSDKTYFREALGAWAAVSRLNFTEITETSSSVGDIRAAYGYDDDMVDAEAYAYLPSNSAVAGDVWFSAEATIAYEVWLPGTYSYLTVLHELGHALGLKHPFSGSTTLPAAYDSMSYSLMSYAAAAGDDNTYFSFYPTTPMVLDVQAIQYLYGVNYTTRSGDTVYAFDDQSTYHETIWDGGGHDTIAYTGFRNATIDLNAGQGSFVGTPVHVENVYGSSLYAVRNIWIAYGVSIENATGGTGNDSITGNAAGNYLHGGAGNDTLMGGAGNDYFDWDLPQRGGFDVFHGGAGDDVFVLDSSKDSVNESANEGTDTVWVEFPYSLASLPNVENLSAMSAGGYVLTGNSLGNTFQGGGGNDTINGELGNDTVVYSQASTSFVITPVAASYTISSSLTGTDVLSSIEFARFSDRTVSLVTDTTAPSVLAFTPADGASGVAVSASVVASFSEQIARGTGSIVLKTAAGVIVETYNAATSPNLSISGTVLTINPSADLSWGTSYAVMFAAGTVKDLAGNNYSGTSTYDFATVLPPASAGNDIYFPGVGDETYDGLAGIDTVIYSAGRSSYALAQTPSGFTLTDNAGTGGTDTLANVERLKFGDSSLALDVTGQGAHAGEVAKILGAVFGAAAVSNMAYAGRGLALRDGGLSYEELAALAMAATGKTAYGDVVDLLWSNVVGTAIPASDKAQYVGLLEGGMSVGAFTALAADTSLNTSHINLAGLAEAGLPYQEFAA